MSADFILNTNHFTVITASDQIEQSGFSYSASNVLIYTNPT
jgi:hypothetical protein